MATASVKEEEIHQCGQCGKVATSWCGRCKQIHYCSRECQVKHWKSTHKGECDGHIIGQLHAMTDLIMNQKPCIADGVQWDIVKFLDACPSLINIQTDNEGKIVNESKVECGQFTEKIKSNECYFNWESVYHDLFSKMYPFLKENVSFVCDPNLRDAIWDMTITMTKDRKGVPSLVFAGVAVLDSINQCTKFVQSSNQQKYIDAIELFFKAIKSRPNCVSLGQNVNYCQWFLNVALPYYHCFKDRKVWRKQRKEGKHGIYCSYCQKRENGQSKFSVCIACKEKENTTVSYCSRKCQKLDWKYHKPQCASKKLDNQQKEPKDSIKEAK